MLQFIDTHAHLDGEEFAEDLREVIQRAKDAGVAKVFLPAISLSPLPHLFEVCRQYPGYLYPMAGLHPEEVRDDWAEQLEGIKPFLRSTAPAPIAIGEVGLDYYWSREYEKEQLSCFEKQMEWSVESGLPLVIHCRKGQNEMVSLMKHYEKELPGGVFHCFTGNPVEAGQLLYFERFVLGIGGVFTFKSSHLRDELPANVPLSRIVLETDSPYMSPVPMRGKRNESAFVRYVLRQLAAAYGVTEEELAKTTNANVGRVFGISV